MSPAHRHGPSRYRKTAHVPRHAPRHVQFLFQSLRFALSKQAKTARHRSGTRATNSGFTRDRVAAWPYCKASLLCPGHPRSIHTPKRSQVTKETRELWSINPVGCSPQASGKRHSLFQVQTTLVSSPKHLREWETHLVLLLGRHLSRPTWVLAPGLRQPVSTLLERRRARWQARPWARSCRIRPGGLCKAQCRTWGPAARPRLHRAQGWLHREHRHPGRDGWRAVGERQRSCMQTAEGKIRVGGWQGFLVT